MRRLALAAALGLLLPAQAMAAVSPEVGLGAGKLAATAGLPSAGGFTGSVDLGLGGGFAVGAAVLEVGTWGATDPGTYAAGRLSWTPPFGKGVAVVLSAGRGRYYTRGSAAMLPGGSVQLSDHGFVQPALAFQQQATYFLFRHGWRASFGPVFGLDGRVWSLPVVTSDFLLLPPMPLALNWEYSVGLTPWPWVDLVIGGANGPATSLRFRY